MDWEAERDTWERWTKKTHDYVAAINAFVHTGETEGWDKAGEQPEDARAEDLAEAVVDLVKRANDDGDFDGVRAHVATAHRPLIPWMEKGANAVRNVCWIDDDRVAASLGNPWQGLQAHVFSRNGDVEVLEGVRLVGRTGTAFALVRDDGIELRSGWSGNGRTVSMPVGFEGLPGAYDDFEQGYPEGVLPLPDAAGAVVITNQGVFLSDSDGVRRLYPTPQGVADVLASHAEYAPDEPYEPRFDMIHAAIDNEGELIAVGSQDSQHLVLDRDGNLVAAFGPVNSEYPHHAAFSPDGEWLFANSCHFYNGATIAVRRSDLLGMHVDSYDEDDRMSLVDHSCRVYDSAWLRDSLVLGDASGYARLRGVGPQGQHFVGSSVGGMDVSPNGRFLAIGTYAGFLSIVDTEATEPDPAVIGTTGFAEVRRFVCWEDRILRW